MENLIFKPSKEKLLEAKNKRLEKWEKLDNIKFTKEDKKERDLLDLEIYQAMSRLRERVNKCRKIV